MPKINLNAAVRLFEGLRAYYSLEAGIGRHEGQTERLKRELAQARKHLNDRESQLRATRAALRTERAPENVIERFNKLYYETPNVWQKGRMHWLGVPVLKAPTDLWIYQEILCRLRPDLIVETGTADGGSALFLASVCEQIGAGRVVSVDISERGPVGEARPEHARIRYLLGSSTDEEVVKQVKAEAEGAESVLVILDSDHAEHHVFREMQIYAPLVSVGSYLIVEDTNVNGHPVLEQHGPGPMEAVKRFLNEEREGRDFVTDKEKERLMLTFNPGGYLKRIR